MVASIFSLVCGMFFSKTFWTCILSSVSNSYDFFYKQRAILDPDASLPHFTFCAFERRQVSSSVKPRFMEKSRIQKPISIKPVASDIVTMVR